MLYASGCFHHASWDSRGPGGGKKREEEVREEVSWNVEETDGARWVLSE